MGLIKKIKSIFNYKNSYTKSTINQILLAGGWGYGNTGDEAQCNALYLLLNKRYPEYQVKILTPDPNYTYCLHHADSDFASRVAIFNEGLRGDCFRFENNKKRKKRFKLRCYLMLLNAYLMRANLPTIFITSAQAKFLQQLKESSLFVFGGGGYLTGSTVSRLWDGMLICRLCEILKTPVVMSGQTIGVWGNEENKRISKIGFRNVKAISLRDKNASKKDLNEIGIKDNIYICPDDALFCEKSTEQLINEKYIALNFHYWGMKEDEKNLYIKKLHNIITYLYEYINLNIIFIPMHCSDVESYNDYIKIYPEEKTRFKLYEYDYDFRKIRRVIADSEICVTMKHHPIIFAMGECVPCISLAFSSYYEHKNKGALEEYGQEKYLVTLNNDDYLDKFMELIKDVFQNKERIKSEIKENLLILADKKECFMKKVDEVLANKSENL